MTYELAKQLKDAGFPINWEISCGHCGYDNGADSPTLSELIYACGERFGSLTQCGLNYKSSKAVREIETNHRIPGGWEATSTEGKEEHYWWEWGSNPEEAVALLYIKLHKKNA